MLNKLDEQGIRSAMADVAEWSRIGDAISRTWSFRDFKAAMGFVTQVACLAERHDHHPELWNVYNQVKLTFTTHDAGGLTELDFQMAREIDTL